jgi:hypothetical protein
MREFRWPGVLALISFFSGGGPTTMAWAASTKLFTVAPCRVLDTRTGSPLVANIARVVAMAGAACGIPVGAQSVVANVTVVGPSANGSLVVYPAGSSIPGTSTLNFSAGATRANNAQILLGASGSANFVLGAPAGATANLLVDVLGYFGGGTQSPFAIGGATVKQRINLARPDTGTLISNAVATTTGSLLLCSIARGVWTSAGAPVGPADNQANAYSILGAIHDYSGFPGSKSAVYNKIGATGSASHTFSVTWGPGGNGAGGGGDEVTVSAVEVKGATLVSATTFVERPKAATVSGMQTSTTGPGVLVSFCWGTGGVGTTHDFRPGAGWTRIDAATAVGDPSPSGYIQVAVAYRVVAGATTDTVTWSNLNTSEGAQIYTIALQ